MRRTFREFLRGRQSERGAAAVEFALILPAVAILYAGTVDLNMYISVNRKVSNATGILSDLITQNISAITAAAIDDAFEGASLAMKPIPSDAISLDIRDYRIVDDVVKQQWRRKSASGPTCEAPSTSGLKDLMASGNDIIVATICTDYEPALSQAMGKYVLGAASFRIQSQVNLRPRESSTIDCLDC